MMTIAATGCTQDNPAFDSTGADETANGDGDPTTTLNSADSESGSGQEDPDASCDLQGGIPLEIDLGPAGCADSPESYDRLHQLVMIDGSTLWVGSCPPGAMDCSQCENDIPTPLNFAPLDLTGLAPDGACLHVTARRSDPTNPDGCRFQSVIVESAQDTTRRAILVGRNTPTIALPAFANNSPLVGFNPVLTCVESCPGAEFPDACCEVDVAPTVYALDIGVGNPVAIGGTQMLQFPNDIYEFKTLDAFQSGECGESTREAWSLIAQ
jgi:hypothetical protein